MTSFAGYKIHILQAKESINVVQVVKENHFDENYIFSGKQGLNVAVAIYNPFDPSTHKHIDPAYGRIRVRKTKWERVEAGVYYPHFEELTTHNCSSEELGFSCDDHKFWPINKANE